VTASAITAPLERRFGQIPGMNQMSSTSSAGASVITLQFALEISMGVAEQEVQAAINAAEQSAAERPADAAGLPQGQPGRHADHHAGGHLASLPLPRVHDLVDTRIAQKLAQMPGVGMVSLAGGQRPAVRMQINPPNWPARPQPRRRALGDQRRQRQPAQGQLRRTDAYHPDGCERPAALGRGVPQPGHRLARRRAAAAGRRGPDRKRRRGSPARRLVGRLPAVLVNIQRQPGANVIEVVDRVQALLPQLSANLPDGG
jgi:multidrug efflux pump